jgi:hypothetical protein
MNFKAWTAMIVAMKAMAMPPKPSMASHMLGAYAWMPLPSWKLLEMAMKPGNIVEREGLAADDGDEHLGETADDDQERGR